MSLRNSKWPNLCIQQHSTLQTRFPILSLSSSDNHGPFHDFWCRLCIEQNLSPKCIAFCHQLKPEILYVEPFDKLLNKYSIISKSRLGPTFIDWALSKSLFWLTTCIPIPPPCCGFNDHGITYFSLFIASLAFFIGSSLPSVLVVQPS